MASLMPTMPGTSRDAAPSRLPRSATGAARDVVQDHRQQSTFSAIVAEMPVQPFLRRLVVVRDDRQAAVGADVGFAYSASAMASAVELAPVPAMTGTRPARMLDRRLDQQAMLLDVDRRRLAGRADDHDAGRAVRDVEIDELAQRGQVEGTALLHRRRDRDEASGQH